MVNKKDQHKCLSIFIVVGIHSLMDHSREQNCIAGINKYLSKFDIFYLCISVISSRGIKTNKHKRDDRDGIHWCLIKHERGFDSSSLIIFI